MRAATAGLASGLALAVVVGGLTDPVVLLVATLLVQGLFAAVWLTAVGVAGAAAGRVLVAAAAVAADVAVVAGDDTRPMAHVPPVLALALVAALAQQLARRDGRPGLAASLAAVVTGTVVAALGSSWLAVDASQHGAALLAVGAVAAAGVPLVDAALPPSTPRPAADGLAALVALAAGALATVVTDVGSVAALAVAVGSALAARLGVLTARRVATPQVALVASLPLLLAGPVAYLLGRLLVG